MLGLGAYRRWQVVRQADRELEIAKVQVKLMGGQIARIDGPFCLETVFRFPTCDCCKPGPGHCGNKITRTRFIWHGRCEECSIKQKELAKRRR